MRALNHFARLLVLWACLVFVAIVLLGVPILFWLCVATDVNEQIKQDCEVVVVVVCETSTSFYFIFDFTTICQSYETSAEGWDDNARISTNDHPIRSVRFTHQNSLNGSVIIAQPNHAADHVHAFLLQHLPLFAPLLLGPSSNPDLDQTPRNPTTIRWHLPR
jgi:hypothetical protein